MNKNLLGILIIIIVLGGGFIAWNLYNHQESTVTQQTNTESTDQNEQKNENSGSKEPDNNPEEVSPIVDTSNWKTYENTLYGFSFKYPEDWDVVQTNYGFIVKSPDFEPIKLSQEVNSEGEINVLIHDNPDKLSIEDLYSTFDDTSQLWFQKYPYSKINNNGNEIVFFEVFQESESSPLRKEAIVSKDDLVLSFSYLIDEKNKNKNYEIIFNFIVENTKIK